MVADSFITVRSSIWLEVFLATINNATFLEAVNTADSVVVDMEAKFPELGIGEEHKKYGGPW